MRKIETILWSKCIFIIDCCCTGGLLQVSTIQFIIKWKQTPANISVLRYPFCQTGPGDRKLCICKRREKKTIKKKTNTTKQFPRDVDFWCLNTTTSLSAHWPIQEEIKPITKTPTYSFSLRKQQIQQSSFLGISTSGVSTHNYSSLADTRGNKANH